MTWYSRASLSLLGLGISGGSSLERMSIALLAVPSLVGALNRALSWLCRKKLSIFLKVAPISLSFEFIRLASLKVCASPRKKLALTSSPVKSAILSRVLAFSARSFALPLISWTYFIYSLPRLNLLTKLPSASLFTIWSNASCLASFLASVLPSFSKWSKPLPKAFWSVPSWIVKSLYSFSPILISKLTYWSGKRTTPGFL